MEDLQKRLIEAENKIKLMQENEKRRIQEEERLEKRRISAMISNRKELERMIYERNNIGSDWTNQSYKDEIQCQYDERISDFRHRYGL